MNWPQFHFAAQTQGQGSVQYDTSQRTCIHVDSKTTNLTDIDEHTSPINFN